LVWNAGRLVYFDAQGNGAAIPWTAAVSNPEDIGLVQKGLFEESALEPLPLKDVQLRWTGGNFIAVEDGAPLGHGAVLYFAGQ
jgi:hypothetical protein